MKKTKIIALLAAVAASLLIYQLLVRSTPKEAPEIVYQSVVAAKTDIPKGTTITEDMLTLQQVPQESVFSQMFSDPEYVVGSVAYVDIMAQQNIMSTNLIGHTGAAYNIPENMRAVTLILDMENGVANLIQPGDNIDVIYTYLPAGQGQEAGGAVSNMKSRYLLENIRVLAVSNQVWNDPASSTEQQGDTSSVVLTLLVTPRQALELEGTKTFVASGGGNIRTVLRQPDDEGLSGGIEYDTYYLN